MEKRGVSIFVFTIMFTLIAGAIILMFFFSFGTDILDFSEKVTEVENILILEKNLASFALSPNSEKTIYLPEKSEVTVVCDTSTKKINITSGNKEKETKKLIFTPFPLKEKTIQAWTLAWNYPFKIDNLYFLADKNTKFYFPEASSFSSGSKAEYFFKRFPSKFDKKTSISSSILENAVIVYFNEPPISTPSGQNIKVVQFDLEESNPIVKFKKEGRLSSAIQVWGDAMVYAAIFSADYEQFNCIIQGLAKQRINNMIGIYRHIIPQLARDDCSSEYGGLNTFLNQLSDGDIKAAKNIKLLNENLKTSDCPKLFEGVETEILLQS